MQKLLSVLALLLGVCRAFHRHENNYVPDISEVRAELHHHKPLVEEKGVIVLDDESFDDFLRHHDYAMVVMYAPWCSRSMELLQYFEQAAEVLRTEMPPTPFAKININDYPHLTERFKLHDLPIMNFYIGQRAVNQFVVRPDLQKILDFVRKYRSPISEPVKDESSLEMIKAHHKMVIGYFGPKDEKYNQFQQATQIFEEILFVHSFDPEFRESIGADIVIFKNYEDEERVDYNGTFKSRDIKDFIIEHRYPSVQPFTDDEAFIRIFYKKNPALVLFSDKPIHDFPDFMDLAYENSESNLVFTHSPFSSGLGQKLAEYVGVRYADLPVVYAIRPIDDNFHIHKFKMDGKITKDNMKTFIGKFKNGDLERHYKSDFVVTDEGLKVSEGPMKEIVAKTFEEEVIATNNHAIVMFYYHWCVDSFKFEASVQLVSERMANNKKLQFFKMDMTLNDHAHVEHVTDPKEYPVIMYYNPRNKERPIQYKDKLDEDHFFNFVREQLAFDYVKPIHIDKRRRQKILVDYGAH